MIIDFHTHCFPDTLAPKALSALKDHALQSHRFPCTNGTISGTETHISNQKMPTEFGSMQYGTHGLHFWVHNLKRN